MFATGKLPVPLIIPADKTKICNSCGQLLHISLFTKSSGGNYLRSKCNKCQNEQEKIRKKIRTQVDPPPSGYKCPICERNHEQIKDKGGVGREAWCCDHDHKTKKFRGWLCHDCNRGLGVFHDDPKLFLKAIQYLNNN